MTYNNAWAHPKDESEATRWTWEGGLAKSFTKCGTHKVCLWYVDSLFKNVIVVYLLRCVKN